MPSRVRQTASASIFPPLVNSITGLRPDVASVRGGPVEIGLSRVEGAVGGLVIGRIGFSSSGPIASGEGELLIN
jgi:hypothetical protein